MRHSSLRWRVTAVVIGVAALLVVMVGVVVDLVLERQLNHQLDTQLSVHVQRATMLIGVRAALRPLDTMTSLAEAITAGDRGRRLRPRLRRRRASHRPAGREARRRLRRSHKAG